MLRHACHAAFAAMRYYFAVMRYAILIAIR